MFPASLQFNAKAFSSAHSDFNSGPELLNESVHHAHNSSNKIAFLVAETNNCAICVTLRGSECNNHSVCDSHREANIPSLRLRLAASSKNTNSCADTSSELFADANCVPHHHTDSDTDRNATFLFIRTFPSLFRIALQHDISYSK